MVLKDLKRKKKIIFIKRERKERKERKKYYVNS